MALSCRAFQIDAVLAGPFASLCLCRSDTEIVEHIAAGLMPETGLARARQTLHFLFFGGKRLALWNTIHGFFLYSYIKTMP